MIYCQTRFKHATGLGNRLWPWSRCQLFAADHGLQVISPRWYYPPRIGPLVKQRVDLRTWPGHLYLDQFQAHPREITGLRRAVLEMRAETVDEPAGEDSVADGARDRVVVFGDDRGKFRELLGRHEELSAALWQITRPRWRAKVEALGDVTIAIHVRLTDFVTPKDLDELNHGGALRSPGQWFIDTLRAVRAALGAPNAPAYVFSDGREDQLQPLLSEASVRLVRGGSPISDMLSMSSARVLIGSGGSSFSGWAAFLGGMPTVTYPGQSLEWFGLRSTPAQFIGAFDPARPDAAFLAQLAEQRRAG